MKTIALFVLALIVVCIAQDQGCCTPDVWQGDISGFSRDLNLYWFEYTYYDWASRAIRADIYENYDDKELVYTYLELYDDNAVYLIKADGTCKYETTSAPGNQACIPEGGHRFPTTIGGSLQADLFIYESFVGQNITEFGVTSGSCFPIFGLFLERQQEIFLGDWEISYWNLLPYISDPFVFKPPVNCDLVSPGTILQFEKNRLANLAAPEDPSVHPLKDFFGNRRGRPSQ